ncbi:MAG: helix-turn-helix transcriptional regulator [Actinomycetales bacterium]|mgnify:CR=1 FL=1|nr:helix-turn-helix transcriptional regulator [Actinomycetales bacterium]
MLTTVRDLGAAVRDARRRAGLTQQALADRAGVPRQWVSRLETGSNPGAEFRKVLDLLAALDLVLALEPAPPHEDDLFDDLFESPSSS